MEDLLWRIKFSYKKHLGVRLWLLKLWVKNRWWDLIGDPW